MYSTKSYSVLVGEVMVNFTLTEKYSWPKRFKGFPVFISAFAVSFMAADGPDDIQQLPMNHFHTF